MKEEGFDVLRTEQHTFHSVNIIPHAEGWVEILEGETGFRLFDCVVVCSSFTVVI